MDDVKYGPTITFEALVKANETIERLQRELADERGWNFKRREQFDRIGKALDARRQRRETGEPARSDADEVEALVAALDNAERELATASEMIASMQAQRNQAAREREEQWQARVKAERERDEALAEAQEQARLLGMGSEREARLMAERDEARAELERLKHQNNSLLELLAKGERYND